MTSTLTDEVSGSKSSRVTSKEEAAKLALELSESHDDGVRFRVLTDVDMDYFVVSADRDGVLTIDPCGNIYLMIDAVHLDVFRQVLLDAEEAGDGKA